MTTLIDGTTQVPDNGDTGWGSILNTAINAIDGRFTYVDSSNIPATKALASGILGTTLASNVVTSSLTTIGTLTSLTVSGNVTISGNLSISGTTTGSNAPVTKTSSFSLGNTENTVICNGTGSITVTLPAASSWTGREVLIKTIAAQTVVSNASNVVPLAGGAAGTAILANVAGRWARLISDGTNWVIMAAN